MILYDPNIIHKYAQKLYERARVIVILYGVFGALLGLILAGAVWQTLQTSDLLNGLCVLLFGALGALIGRKRSFELLLEAQAALCQVQIELNTRPPDTTRPQARA